MPGRYARRAAVADRYAPDQPDVMMARQEKERVLLRCLRTADLRPLAQRWVLEIGCGHGRNLQLLLSLGFRPEHLVGNELLPDRLEAARGNLPPAVELHGGDACALELPAASFDVVFQSTVFTSILDPVFQQVLARRMWGWVKPGGGVLWYDFMFNNPRNPDVRGVPYRTVQALFPGRRVYRWRLTLAPPLARRVCAWHPSLYTLFNACPWLRTHWLCWIPK